jgi:hypothetical protein
MQPKPGYLTTEFWIAILAGVGATVAAAADWLPPRYAALAATVSAAAYALSRGLAKKPTAVIQVPPPPAA